MVEPPKLWDHQQLVLDKAKVHNELALFMEMGVGKSRAIVEVLRYLFNKHKRIMRTIIVCPKSVCPNWVNEIKKYSKIPTEKIFLLTGSLDQRISLLKNCPDGSIFICNFEGFAFDKFVKSVLLNPPDVLVIDESQKIKGFQAKRTKNLIKVTQGMDAKSQIAHEPVYRYILTGTPVTATMLDIFSQFYVLDGGKLLGKNYFAFRAKYFYDKNSFMPKQRHFPNWAMKPNAEEQLKQVIADKCILARKSDCLSLPPLVRTEIEVDLSPEQKRHYEEMRKEFITFVENSAVTAQLAITKALRMQQILSGFLKTDEGEEIPLQQNPRADALEELLESISSKAIVWSIFKHDYKTIKDICNKLGLKYAEVTGEVTDKQKELDMFEKDPECRVMIASQKAGGVGVNMTSADTMIYYSRSYSLEDDLQSESRNYRGGSEIHKKITRIDLVARQTVDELVLKALREKKNLADRILDLKDLL